MIAGTYDVIKSKAFILRLMMSLSCIYIRTPLGISHYVYLAIEMITSAKGNNIAKQIGLELLYVLPIEVESYDCSRESKCLIQNDTLNALSKVLTTVQDVSREQSNSLELHRACLQTLR